MARNLFAPFIILFALPLVSAIAAPYKIADLEYLESTKDYREFFLHAKDIRPSERNDYWRKIVRSMGQQFTSSMLKNERFQQSQFDTLLSISSWVELKDDDVFQDRKNRIVLQSFPKCINDKALTVEQCSKWLDAIMADSSAETKVRLFPFFDEWEEIALAAEKSVDYAPWDFVKDIVASPLGEFYCGKEDIAKVLYSKMLDAKNIIVHDDCWKSFGPYVVANFFSLPVADQVAVIKWPRLQSLIDKDMRELFHVYYLMDGTWPDADENIKALNNLDRLASRPQLREKLISKLKSVKFLPDGAFAEEISDNKKTELLGRMNESFPELLDLYTSACFDYIEGKRAFPEGNPTLHCRDIMGWAKEHKMTKVFSDQAWNRFKKQKI